MKRLILPAVLLAGLTATVPAFAAITVGRVAATDPAELRLTLSEGEAFTLPDLAGARAVLASLPSGALVAVTEDSAPDGSWNFDAVWPNYERDGNRPR